MSDRRHHSHHPYWSLSSSWGDLPPEQLETDDHGAPQYIAPSPSSKLSASTRELLSELERSVADFLVQNAHGASRRHQPMLIMATLPVCTRQSPLFSAWPPIYHPRTVGAIVQHDDLSAMFTSDDVYVALHNAPVSPVVEKAQDEVNEHYRSALAKQGLSQSLVDTLDEWLDAKARGMAMQYQLSQARVEAEAVAAAMADADAQSAAASAPKGPAEGRDALELLGAADLAARLGVSDETVRNRERAGELFSVLAPGRKRGREYPAFQAWPEFAGDVLTGLLQTLGAPARDGASLHGFFGFSTDLLGGLTPVEAVVGSLLTSEQVDESAQAFLQRPAQERLASVRRAAKTYATALGGA